MFFATSDVSDAVASGEEVEETESEFFTETCAFEAVVEVVEELRSYRHDR